MDRSKEEQTPASTECSFSIMSTGQKGRCTGNPFAITLYLCVLSCSLFLSEWGSVFSGSLSGSLTLILSLCENKACLF